jgi:hypothetical protein
MPVSTQIFTNNASALLAAGINSVATSIQVESGYGALFPSPGANQHAILALEDAAGHIEYVKCTGRSTDVLTVVRAQEGSTALNWLTGDRIEVRLTRGTLERMIQVEGGHVKGNYTFDDAITFAAAAALASGSTIAGSTVWHAGNDGIGSGLDADTLQGLLPGSGTTYEAGKLVRYSASGHVFANHFSQASTDAENPALTAGFTQVMVTLGGGDNFFRKCTLSYFVTQMQGLISIDGASQVTGTVPTATAATTATTATKLATSGGAAPVYGVRAWGTFDAAASGTFGNCTVVRSAQGVFDVTYTAGAGTGQSINVTVMNHSSIGVLKAFLDEATPITGSGFRILVVDSTDSLVDPERCDFQAVW